MGSLPQYVICKFLILRKLGLRVIFTSDSDLFMFNQKEKEERNTLTITNFITKLILNIVMNITQDFISQTLFRTLQSDNERSSIIQFN